MLATDPTETFDVVLETDKERENPPTFVFRYLTAREFRALARNDALAEAKDADVDKALDALFGAIRANLADWRNVLDRAGNLVAFRPGQLDALITVGEAWELYWSARRQSRLQVPEKNASESPSPTSSDESAAATAKAIPQSAPTGPQPGSPPSSSAADAADEDAPDVMEPETYG